MLLYLKCFLTSFPAPGRGPASPSWGGPMFLLPTLPHCPTRATQVPNCCLPPPSFTLTSFSSSLNAPASEACPVSPSLAAFKLFILYLWFGALRKILIFYLSPFARSRVGREVSFSGNGISGVWDSQTDFDALIISKVTQTFKFLCY